MAILRNLITVLVVISSCFKSSAAEEPPYVQHENIVFGEVHGIGLLMDVFTPEGDGNGLGVIDVMSGAWHPFKKIVIERIHRDLSLPLCCCH